jgi:CRP-like cAMP-binding protein
MIALSRTALFGGLGHDVLKRLAAIAELRVLSANATVFRKGDPGTHLFVIRSGRLKFVSGAADGRDLTLNLLGPGAVFGEVAFADGGARTADVVCVEPVELLALSRRELLPFLREHPETMLQMMTVLAGRVRWMAENFEDSAFLDLPARLAKRLVFLAHHFGFDTPRGRRLAVSLPHKELASHMNVTRESITRALQHWRKEGLIEEARGVFIVCDVARLLEIAQPPSAA